MEKFDVVIVHIPDSKIVSIVGKNLYEKAAEKREMTALSRINGNDYFVAQVPTGKFKTGMTYAR